MCRACNVPAWDADAHADADADADADAHADADVDAYVDADANADADVDADADGRSADADAAGRSVGDNGPVNDRDAPSGTDESTSATGDVCWLAATCVECGALVEGGVCWNCGAKRSE